VEDHELGEVLTAPFDVRLPRGLGDPVEPDILYIRSENLPLEDYFTGVPDLVVEALSPSTRQVDLKIKFAAYEEAGIPEYWLLDPRFRTIVIYHLRDGVYVELDRGGLGDTVRSAVLPAFSVAVAKIFP
jgi:Uma2 family endonuclease